MADSDNHTHGESETMRTHLLTYDGLDVMSMPTGVEDDIFSAPLHNFDGVQPWALTLEPLAPGDSYSDMVEQGRGSTEYLQAAGKADAMTLEIRKPGGAQWNASWVRYVIGHPHNEPAPLDVEIATPPCPIRISCFEVFGAAEATELFIHYYKYGTIPDGYALRPVEAYTTDGGLIDLRDPENPREVP